MQPLTLNSVRGQDGGGGQANQAGANHDAMSWDTGAVSRSMRCHPGRTGLAGRWAFSRRTTPIAATWTAPACCTSGSGHGPLLRRRRANVRRAYAAVSRTPLPRHCREGQDLPGALARLLRRPRPGH